ncbi:hypothetical protein DFJ58DRAFT_657526, partial [Suillus subalutaceus]|uniref:uncharacterized protein n=1 Tax=Suillus subalutaceus TaxID=48586 RepID=UPI001B8603E7
QVLNKWLQQHSFCKFCSISSKARRTREYLDTANVQELTVDEIENTGASITRNSSTTDQHPYV